MISATDNYYTTSQLFQSIGFPFFVQFYYYKQSTPFNQDRQLQKKVIILR